MRLVTTGATPQREQTCEVGRAGAEGVPRDERGICDLDARASPRAGGPDAAVFPQKVQVQARAGISVCSGCQSRVNEMLPQ